MAFFEKFISLDTELLISWNCPSPPVAKAAAPKTRCQISSLIKILFPNTHHSYFITSRREFSFNKFNIIYARTPNEKCPLYVYIIDKKDEKERFFPKEI